MLLAIYFESFLLQLLRGGDGGRYREGAMLSPMFFCETQRECVSALRAFDFPRPILSHPRGSPWKPPPTFWGKFVLVEMDTPPKGNCPLTSNHCPSH